MLQTEGKFGHSANKVQYLDAVPCNMFPACSVHWSDWVVTPKQWSAETESEVKEGKR